MKSESFGRCVVCDLPSDLVCECGADVCKGHSYDLAEYGYEGLRVCGECRDVVMEEDQWWQNNLNR